MNAPTQSGLTLILGPPNSGKRGDALGWWQEKLGQKPLLVMPYGRDAEDMTLEMARRTGGLVGQSPALTLTGLAQLVLGRRGRLIGQFERTLLVAESLRTTKLQALHAVCHLPGVAGAAARLLQELGESGETPAEAGQLLQCWAAAEPESAPLAEDVRNLLSEYVAALGRLGLSDQAQVVREALTAAKGWRRPVALCGFTSFTRGQRALVQALAGETEVLVSLTYERAHAAGLCAPGEAEWWIEQADEIVDVSPRTRAYGSSAIAHLERHFLDGEAQSPPPAEAKDAAAKDAESVRFLLSSGRRAEAESVAEQIAGLIKQGFDPGGIAVVVRQLRAWGQLLGDVFQSCGIPYQTDMAQRLDETGLGYAFLQAVKGVGRDDAEALLSYLRSPYGGVPPDDVFDLESSYRQGVARGVDALASLAGRRMTAALEPVRALVQSAAATRGAGGADAPRYLDLEAAGRLADHMVVAGAKGASVGGAHLETDIRAFKALKSSLAVMAGLASQTVPEVALRALAQAEVPGSGPAGEGAVHIVSAQRARARRFEAVFVLGLVEGEFPGLPDRPSLLSAAQRASLDRLGGGVLPLEPESERALFIGAATRAWRLLYLSARDAEDDGSESAPSRFWVEARELLGAKEEGHQRRTLADQVYSAQSAPSLRHYLRACAAEDRRPYGDPVDVPHWRRVPTRLSAPEVLSELGAQDCFSPSTLESYATCPFAWFVNRLVGREELETELDGRAVGTLIHSVLGDCYESLSADGLLPLTAYSVGEAKRRARALIDDLVSGPDCPGSPAERRVAGHKLQGMADRLFEAEAASGGSLAFKAAEVRVGAGEGVDLGGIRVRGRVDRVDTTTDGKGLFVYDYKSGAIPSAKAIGSAEGLQLPLYLLALGLENQEAQMLGGAYVSLREGELSGVMQAGQEALLGRRAGKCLPVDEQAREQLAEGVLTIAKDMAEGMRQGVIAPVSEGDCPSWCDLGPVCRSKRGARRP